MTFGIFDPFDLFSQRRSYGKMAASITDMAAAGGAILCACHDSALSTAEKAREMGYQCDVQSYKPGLCWLVRFPKPEGG